MTPNFVYRCAVTGVVDGDTLEMVIDVGFRMTGTYRLRLTGVNAPELFKGHERAAGQAAKNFVEQWIEEHGDGKTFPFLVQTKKADAFGRYLGRLIDPETGHSLNDALLASGHAVGFMAEKPSSE